MKNVFTVLLCSFCCSIFSQWSNGWFPDPNNFVPKYEGKPWYRDNGMSDGFNDGWVNGNIWNRRYLNSWNNKGRTRWNSWQDYVQVGNAWGKECAKIGHYWNDNSAGGWANTISCGIISSKKTVKYPVYLEANIRVANAELSSNFWLLEGGENRREIDVVECYGGNSNFEKRATSNYHFFTGWDRKDHFKRSDHWMGQPWRNSFHRFGVLWLNPWDVRFFVDGEQRGYNFWSINLKTGDGKSQLNKNWWNFSTDMHIILDVEEHKNTKQDPVWKLKQGLWNEDRKMFVDYIGVWKPNFSAKELSDINKNKTDEISVSPNPVKKGGEFTLNNIKKGQNFIFSSIDGKIVSSFKISHDGQLFLNTENVESGVYILKVNDKIMKLVID